MHQKIKCFISTTTDPWFNLATEDWILRDMDPSQHVLFLWQNEDAVIIGRNQNPWAECNLQRMEDEKVHLVRRHSGGGAVFQDLGNMNFTFLSSKEEYDKERNFKIIINALKHFNIQAERSGRNDLLVNGKKVSGSAFKETIDRAFHHGTLMMHVDLGRLGNYLTPPQKKLLAKGTTSVRSRVTNLSEFNKEIEKDELYNTIIKEFSKMYDKEVEIETLSKENLEQIPELKKYYEMLKHDHWRFGETPEFDHHMLERLSWGTVDVHLNVEEGKITKVKIFSDAHDTELIEALTKHLAPCDYNKEAVKNNIATLKEKLPKYKEEIEEFSVWLSEEVE